MPSFRRIASGALAARLIGSAVQAVLLLLFARSSEVDAFGAVNAALGILMFMSGILDFGIGGHLARSKARGDSEAVLENLNLGFYASLALLALGGLTVCIAFPGIGLVAALLALAMSVEKYVELVLIVYVAQYRAAVVATNITARRFTALLCFIALQAIGLSGGVSFASAMAVSAVVGLILVFIAGTPRHSLRFEPASSWRSISASVPFFVSNASGQVRSLDVPIVYWIGGAQSGGLYALAARVSSPLLLASSTLAGVVLPHQSGPSAEPVARAAVRWTLVHVAAGVALVPVAVYAVHILPGILGESYAALGGSFVILAASLPIVGLSSVLGAVLQAAGQERLVARNGVLWAILLVAALLVGSQIAGDIGGALAVSVIYTLKSATLLIACIGGKNERN